MKRTRRLKVLRAEREITQANLAKRAGLGIFLYWQIENGERAATADERKVIAAALSVRPSEIEWPTREAVSA